MRRASSGRSRLPLSRWCSYPSTNISPRACARLPTVCMLSSRKRESRFSTTIATPARALSSPTRSCSAFHTGSSWAIADWKPGNSNIAAAAMPKAQSSLSTMPSRSFARAWVAKAGAVLKAQAFGRTTALLAVAALLAVGVAHADQQQDPGLKAVVQQAIGEAECFTDHYDSAVWYTLMEPRLRPRMKNREERLEILKQVYCETHRTG